MCCGHAYCHNFIWRCPIMSSNPQFLLVDIPRFANSSYLNSSPLIWRINHITFNHLKYSLFLLVYMNDIINHILMIGLYPNMSLFFYRFNQSPAASLPTEATKPEKSEAATKNRLVGIRCKVVPQFGIAKLVQITPITMGYSRYKYSYPLVI